jgi:hypothetical protein
LGDKCQNEEDIEDKKKNFGNRILKNKENVFEFNAW